MMMGLITGDKMTILNVIHLGKFKEFRENRRMAKSYSKYLNTLASSQLEIEINILFDEFSENETAQEFITKSQLILKEISARAHSTVKNKIENLNETGLHIVRPIL